MHFPSDAEVDRVQRELGLDRMQAYYHAQGLRAAQQRAEEMRREQYRDALQRWRAEAK